MVSRDFGQFFTSPACGGGRRAKRGGWGLLNARRRSRRHSPTPALTRKRERELTVVAETSNLGPTD